MMTTAAGAPGRVGWMTKGIMVFANVPQAIAFGAVSPVLAEMSRVLADDPADAYLVKMVVGILGVAMVVGAPIAGLLTDRIGRGPLLLGSGILFAAAGVMPAFTDHLGLILFTRFLVGLAAIAFSVAGATLIGDCFDETERPRWMGALVSTAIVAGLVAVPIAGVLGDIGWRWPFLLYLIGIPGAILGWKGAVRTAPAARPAEAAAAGAERAEAESGFPIGLVLLAFAVGMMIYLPTVYIPFHLTAIGIATPSAIGILLTVRSIVSATVASQFGRARKRFSSRALFCFTFAGTGVGMALLAIAPNLPLAVVGLVLVGAGGAWLTSNLFAVAVSGISESRRGRVMGWIGGAKSLAPALGITALEPLTRAAGVDGALMLIGAIAAAIAVGMLLSGGVASAPAMADGLPRRGRSRLAIRRRA
jgi:MFS family permease